MLVLLQMLVDLGYRVTFLPDEASGIESDASNLQRLGIDVVHEASAAGFVERHGHRFESAILCRVGIAAKYISTLVEMRPRPFIVFDTVDLHHLRERRLADLENDRGLAKSAERTREAELTVMRSCNLVWVTSSYEAELLSSDRSLPPVEIVPLVQTVRADIPGFSSRRDMLFIGAFHHLPNEDAVLYFVDEILPLVKAQLPEVRLVVVGSHTPPDIFRLASDDVVVHGFVRDVQPLFDACRVSIAPLRFGAGVKGKIAQSLAWGLPAVATPVAAEGMNLIDGEHVLIASDARQFAAGVVRLYRDETMWRRLSESGRQHVQLTLGYETVRSSVRSMLKRVVPRG
jgi:glycosyltransferase involved in cell wall biosynthesis